MIKKEKIGNHLVGYSRREIKSYEKPKIVYEKKIETLAVTCDSLWIGGGGCMKGLCAKRSY